MEVRRVLLRRKIISIPPLESALAADPGGMVGISGSCALLRTFQPGR
jgi:hypothetical protein